MLIPWYYLVIFLLGLLIGSALHALLLRLYFRSAWWRTKLGCWWCSAVFSWREVIPAINIFFLRGYCRPCRKPLPYPAMLIEVVTALLFALVAWRHQATEAADLFIIRDWFIMSVLVVIFFYDLRWQIILDKVVYSALIIVLVFHLLLNVEWPMAIIGAVVGGGFFLLQYLWSRGQWLGGGDVKLGFLLGLMVGWPNILLIFLIAYVLGGVVGLWLVIRRQKTMTSQLPFGTFLAAAAVITLLFGDQLINWYWRLIS